MSAYRGHCICGAVQVSLKQQPPNTLRCYCRNCARSGGGASINYVVDEAEFTVNETDALQTFEDKQTMSGNLVQRQFFPGKALVKASLFDEISPPNMEVFTDRRQVWERPVEGAKQE
ncbi:Mss4-like protein [Aspergillus karnatakaensis]|uniref:GFA family protein n=1 Tax=Aspergillus karnatakaensis TaxID=1810916 RepID=UPI003CCDB621